MPAHREPPSPKKNSVTRTVLGALRLTYEADRKGFLLAAGFQIVGALSPTVLVLVGQYLLQAITSAPHGRPRLGELIFPVIVLAAMTALTLAAGNLQTQQQRLLGERVAARAWERVLAVSARIRLELYESSAFYDQLQRIKTSAFAQHVSVTSAVFGLIGGLVGVVSLLIVLLTIDPVLIPLLLIAGIPSLFLARRVSSLEFAFLVKGTPVFRAREYLRQTLTGRDEAKEIRTFAAEGALRFRHDTRTSQYDLILSSHVRVRQRYAIVDVVITSAFLAVTLGYVVYSLSRGRIELSAAAAAVLAVRFVSSSLNALFRSIGSLFESSTFLGDLEAFVRDRQRDVEAPATREGIGPLTHAISVRNVTYGYPGGSGLVLKGVDLSIGANEIVALVGENGSGKTTLAKIIAGLYRPASGEIRWDGIDLSQVSQPAVRRQVSVIFQDFVRYQLSALDNVGLGDPDHVDDHAAARDAAYRAGALTYLESLPNGWDTVLSKEYDNGQDLSGGQWQRVALARALRKPSSLIVLDEPTASLDPKAEARLFDDIKQTLRGRAALLISHRFSSVRLADRIYVMSEGCIIEAGTHDSLVAQGGVYADLFRAQATAYR